VTAGTEKRVIPLELFFDLVFVFALTQVTALSHPASRPGVERWWLSCKAS